ncbi:type II toxin-antitoxin system HicB family antitoxin [Methylomicrobium sp. RS1]|jgi:predicted RNase H-like HicB family nuclease|uniref:type II toxin-antitoxin system HicB family antitoxin n=1 Tax=Candidatus Methylomicrobium oryzae TaxID=2802053 RepID=UPI0019223E7A|nr:type II toxin-antitoxin system HicB family antitoxin [Methylomicrobium sp. RS1]
MKLAAVIQPTYQGLTKRFTAYCPDLPGCIAHAPTAEKAVEDLKARVTQQINSRKELGLTSIKNHSQVQVLEV